MKIHILLIFLLSFSTFAQDDFRKERALRFGREQDSIYHASQEMAKKRGIPLTRTLGEGKVLTFQGFSEMGEALYIRTESNSQAARMTKTNLLYPGGSLSLGLTGKSDSLKGKLGMWDGGAILTTHQEFGGRASMQPNQTGSGTSDHATHVAGILVAAGVSPNAKGMAYEADLKVWDFTNDNSEMSTASAASPLLVSNHSYGYQAGWTYDETKKKWQWWGNDAVSTFEDVKFGLYETNAQAWDKIAYNSPNYLIFKSAGNSRSENGPAAGEYYFLKTSTTDSSNVARAKNDGYDIISTSGNAKNILTVGAANLSSLIPTKASEVSISSFTSWGPTDDGRIKPDVMAIGTNMFSTGVANDQAYSTKGGTSMATPQAAGSLYLIQQLYNRLNKNTFMLSSTLKAIAIHTALDMETPGPDYKTGYGLIQIDKAAEVVQNKSGSHLLTESSLITGQTKTYTLISSGKGPLKATIAWTDPEASTSSQLNDRTPRLVNDLDIRLTSGTSTFFPFTLNPATPEALPVAADNIRDNVEQILINNPLPGQSFTLTVSQKGVLKNNTPQSFGLVVSGIGGSSYCNLAPTTSTSNLQTFTLGTAKDSTGLNPVFKAELGENIAARFNFKNTSARQVKLFADWNQDGDFADNGEELYNSQNTSVASATGTIKIPSTLKQDDFYRLRWVIENGSGSNLAPSCGTISSGETKDYSIQIVQASKDFSAISVSQSTESFCASAGNTTFNARIKNVGSATQTNVSVKLEVKNGTTLVGTATGVVSALASNREADVILSGNMTLVAGSTYSLQLSSQLTGDQNATNDLVTSSVTISSPAPPVVTGTICANSTEITLSATNGSPLWYNGTNLVGSGSTLKTTNSGTFFAAFNNFSGTVGPATKSDFGGGTYYSNFGPEPIFIVSQPTILESATVYIGTSGTVTFGIFNKDTGELIASISKDLVATRTQSNSTTVNSQLIDDKTDPGQTVVLNLPFPKAGNYILSHVCSNGASIFRSNRTKADTVNAVTNIGYPYTIPGVLTLTGALFNDGEIQSGYYYLYGMKFKSYACPSPRVQVAVTTGTSPVITVSPTGASKLCVGEKLTITATAASGNPTYQWLKNGVSIAGATTNKLEVSTSGNYQVNASFNGTCPVVSAISAITTTTPVEPTISFDKGILTSSAGTEIQWFFNDVAIAGATTTTYKPTANGTYKVRLKDANGCLTSASLGVIILATTLDNPNSNMYAYPNPTHHLLTVGLPKNYVASNYRIRISDFQGRIIQEETIVVENFAIKLDVSKLNRGNYVLSFPELEESGSIKFTKN